MSESLLGIRQHQHPPIKILIIASKNELNQNPKITKRYTYRKAKNEQKKTAREYMSLINNYLLVWYLYLDYRPLCFQN